MNYPVVDSHIRRQIFLRIISTSMMVMKVKSMSTLPDSPVKCTRKSDAENPVSKKIFYKTGKKSVVKLQKLQQIRTEKFSKT